MRLELLDPVGGHDHSEGLLDFGPFDRRKGVGRRSPLTRTLGAALPLT